MKKVLPNLFAMIGVVVGVIVLILGISLLAQETGELQAMDNIYGADFYTDSYEATARAANNVQAMADVLAKGIGYLLIAFGLFDICLFGQKVMRGVFGTKPIKEVEEKQVQVPPIGGSIE